MSEKLEVEKEAGNGKTRGTKATKTLKALLTARQHSQGQRIEASLTLGRKCLVLGEFNCMDKS